MNANEMIYLDNAASTQLDYRVIGAMMPWFTIQYGNPGSIHPMGRMARQAVEDAREHVALLFGASPEQIIFTSGGTEANNLVFAGLTSAPECLNRTLVITADTDHKSVLRASEAYSRNVVRIPVTLAQGFDLGSLRDHVSDQTALVSVAYVNNETGHVAPVEEIGDICRSHSVPLHLDCVQALYHDLDMNLPRHNAVEFASISSHKIHGPMGVGALYVRNRKALSPMVFGGEHQEFGMRGGTENVPGIVGFGRAAQLLFQERDTNRKKCNELSRLFLSWLTTQLQLPQSFLLNHPNGEHDDHILNLCFPDIDANSLVLLLGEHGVCVSAGSACNGQEDNPSHVLTAMGLPEHRARSSIRVSFSADLTPNDVMQAADEVAACCSMLYALH